MGREGRIAQWIVFSLCTLAASGSILGVPGEIYSVDVAEIHRQYLVDSAEA